jgi:hypothetical protein
MTSPREGFDSPDPSPDRPEGPASTVSDLPEVEEPSVDFIVQLFVIPAVVVAVVIVVWLLFGKLAGGERDAREYVRLLRSPDANWRAAFELASLIQNDATLARDPELLGDLTDLLDHDLDGGDNPLLTQYVALTLGAFQTLDARAPNGQPVDPLATLGRALSTKQPSAVRIAAAASLAKHAARLDGKLDDARAVAALDQASREGEPEERQMAVYALGFFGGEPAAAILRDRLNDPDRFVRYNVAVALGRRGDAAALGMLREMLSMDDLTRVLPIESAAEKQSKVEAIVLEALQALQTAIDRGPTGLALVEPLRPQLEVLGRSRLASVRTQALGVLQAAGRSAPGKAA